MHGDVRDIGYEDMCEATPPRGSGCRKLLTYRCFEVASDGIKG